MAGTCVMEWAGLVTLPTVNQVKLLVVEIDTIATMTDFFIQHSH